jgi:hypothetical protein
MAQMKTFPLSGKFRKTSLYFRYILVSWDRYEIEVADSMPDFVLRR